MSSSVTAVGSPQLAYLVPVILLVPFASIVVLAVVLNWGR